MPNLIPKEFFLRSPLEVAPQLLGKILLRNLDGKIISGRIVETEAYLGPTDPAAHSYIGKTKRNASLFGEAGHLYVHTIHTQKCVDIVCQEVGTPTSVLIRALEPLEGGSLMKKHRNKEKIIDLTTGPGKLCQALAITRELDGIDATRTDSPVQLWDDGYELMDFVIGKRVGITKAAEQEYRFFLRANKFVSKK